MSVCEESALGEKVSLHVVGGVLDRVADLANDALIWLIDVWCRHYDVVEEVGWFLSVD
jgi:hypothetical protein